MTPGIKTHDQLTEELSITRWYAESGNYTGVHSAIVNVRRHDDRQRVKKVYIYYDYKIDSYVTERA